MLRRAFVVWWLLLGLAIVNGAVRELAFTPRLGPAVAHVLSTATLIAIILEVSWAMVSWMAPPTAASAWAIGFAWAGLTLAFEFLGGHYLFGTPWNVLLADYNLAAGRVWLFVPIVTVLAPFLAFFSESLRASRARHA